MHFFTTFILSLLFINIFTNIALAARCPSKGGKMQIIPKGFFFSGSENKLKYIESSYCIDILEVSAKDYQECVDDGVCPSYEEWKICQQLNMRKSPNQCFNNRGHYPANYITWSGAKKFCDWAGKRLLKKEEWEKAAKGIFRRSYPWGNKTNCGKAHFARGRYFTKCLNYENIHNFPAPVTSYPQSRSFYGIYNMSGNVQEWISHSGDIRKNNALRTSMGGDYKGSELDITTSSSKNQLGPNLTTQGHGIRCGASL